MKHTMKHILTLSFIALLFIGCANQPNQEENNSDADTTAVSEEVSQDEKPDGYQPGELATDFKLPGTADTMVSLADYTKAKGFIVTFTCNHCPYAVKYEDRIIALHNKYAALGYPVVAINPNDPEVQPDDDMENMKIRAEEKGFPFAYVIDEGQNIFPQYGATKTPHVFVLQKEDEGLRVHYVGAIDNNYKDPEGVTERYVEDAVDALLNDMEVEVASTKAIGCSIKTKS